MLKENCFLVIYHECPRTDFHNKIIIQEIPLHTISVAHVRVNEAGQG